MLKSCKYCGKIHDSKYDCGKKPKPKKRYDTDKDKFRNTMLWQNKRSEVRELDKELCVVCREEGRYIYNSLSCHHIEPLEDRFDLRLENENLITLCGYHHELAEHGEITKEYLYKLINKYR